MGPTLSPWKLADAQLSPALVADRAEFDQACHNDWSPLRLTVVDRLMNVPFRKMATLEIQPGEMLVRNGFPLTGKLVTQDDFPSLIATIARAAETELGVGAGSPVARAGEATRKPK